MIDASDSETQKGLETGEIVADCVGFILAGYETTSTALTFATYLLATNPDVQERLANEIHEYFEENPVSDTMYIFVCFCCTLFVHAHVLEKCLYCPHRTSPCTMPHTSCSTLTWCWKRLSGCTPQHLCKLTLKYTTSA